MHVRCAERSRNCVLLCVDGVLLMLQVCFRGVCQLLVVMMVL